MRRHLNRTRIALAALTISAILLVGCGPSTLHKLNIELNTAAKSLNAAARTNHQFYETAVYGPVGSAGAIKIRQEAATIIHDANEQLIVALTLAKALTVATFEQGKLAVLQALSQAAAMLHISNQTMNLVLQDVAAVINQVVVIVQAFSAADFGNWHQLVIPQIQKLQIGEIAI